jgi:hypothetical protein
VSDEENNHLIRPFSEEEVKSVVMNMKRNTAPGPDHIPIEFYQVCREFIKEDILNLFQGFWTHSLDVDRLNYGVITLIPKTKEAAKIQQFRPICLLNVIYQIITKTLMLRFEDCMSRIISSSQNAFIKGRNIMDGVLCLHEILHDTRVRKKDGIVLKLDFEKAYDKINWDFLFEVLKQRGFSETWCRWLRTVVCGGTLSVKVNGNMGSYFKSGKGVRQGDPLSPLLFNLAADSLAKMVQIAQRNGLVRGLAPEYIPNGIAILQYADDTILCLDDDEDTAQNMKLLLYIYEKMSGLKINFEKSEVLMISTDSGKTIKYSDMYNCAVGQWPIKYLGVPVAGSGLRIRDWMKLVERVLKKLDGWQCSSLSSGGELILLDACLGNIPTYAMSMYLLPKKVVKKIDGTMKRFIWQEEVPRKNTI